MKNLTTKRGLGCAIYTRVSTDQVLEQDLNSLDAQGEASRKIRLRCSPPFRFSPLGSVDASPGGDRDATLRVCKMRSPAVTRSGTASITSCGSRSTGFLYWAEILGNGRGSCCGRLRGRMRWSSTLERLAVFAEFERDILRDRVKAGIAHAKRAVRTAAPQKSPGRRRKSVT
jgi:hypothetical protein